MAERLTDDDIVHFRAETPGCAEVMHFNNAGAALMPAPVLKTMKEHLDLEAATGGYEAAAIADDKYTAVYESIGTLLNASPDEIALVVNATRAWDMAFYSFQFSKGDKILTAVSEYISNYLAFLQVAERTGADVIPVPNDDSGQLSVDSLRDLVDDRVKLIAVTHVPTNGGLINPAADIGKVAREHGIPYLLDACQSAGQMPLDVEAIGCDILTATGRKYLRGPRGCGFLYVRDTLVDKLKPPFIDMRAAEWTSSGSYRLMPSARRFETWENNVAAMLGLGAAVDYALGIGIDKIEPRVIGIAQNLRERLEDIPTVSVHDLGVKKCGIVSFSSPVVTAEEIKSEFRNRRMNVSISEPSSTLLDATSRDLPTVVRASVHYYNTDDEVGTLCACLADLVNSR